MSAALRGCGPRVHTTARVGLGSHWLDLPLSNSSIERWDANDDLGPLRGKGRELNCGGFGLTGKSSPVCRSGSSACAPLTSDGRDSEAWFQWIHVVSTNTFHIWKWHPSDIKSDIGRYDGGLSFRGA